MTIKGIEVDLMTKENYEDAIMRMYDFCIASNHPAQIKEQFTQDLDFLAKLANEHFEEKQETNYEYYKDEIIEKSNLFFALVDGKPHQCSDVSCCNCGFSTGHGCREKIEEWLKSPYKKPVYKLTKFEKELLECYSDVYSFKVFNSLNGMKEKGYFKGIDDNELIGEILAKCEVV